MICTFETRSRSERHLNQVLPDDARRAEAVRAVVRGDDEGGDCRVRGGVHHAEGAAAAQLPPNKRLGGQQRQGKGGRGAEELQAAALILAIQGWTHSDRTI